MRSAGIFNLPPCIIRQFGDLTGCVKPGCDLQWDTNDPEPPQCPLQRPSLAQLGREAQRRVAPYSEPRRRLRGILFGSLPIYLSLAIGIGYLAWDFGPHVATWLAIKWLGL